MSRIDNMGWNSGQTDPIPPISSSRPILDQQKRDNNMKTLQKCDFRERKKAVIGWENKRSIFLKKIRKQSIFIHYLLWTLFFKKRVFVAETKSACGMLTGTEKLVFFKKRVFWRKKKRLRHADRDRKACIFQKACLLAEKKAPAAC